MRFLQAVHFRPGPVGIPREITNVVIHSTEGKEILQSGENTADWIAGKTKHPAPMASFGYVVDADSIVQCVKDQDIAFHAPGLNATSIGVELAGQAHQSREEWLDSYSTQVLELAAALVADLCKKYKIPVVEVGPLGLQRKLRGITTHAAVTAAFKRSTHTDPGAGFPMDHFLSMVQKRMGPIP